MNEVDLHKKYRYGIIVGREGTMGKPKKEPPPVVRFAIVLDDYGALSRLGRAGAKKRKEISAKDREKKVKFMLACAAQIAQEANEDLCPVDVN
jgi:hypothetical protein